MRHLRIRVGGRVQGVFFRASTRERAQKLGLKGYVRNDEDGSVLIEAEGDANALDEFVRWCHRGPTGAVVSSVVVEEGEWRGFREFEINR